MPPAPGKKKRSPGAPKNSGRKRAKANDATREDPLPEARTPTKKDGDKTMAVGVVGEVKAVPEKEQQEVTVRPPNAEYCKLEGLGKADGLCPFDERTDKGKISREIVSKEMVSKETLPKEEKEKAMQYDPVSHLTAQATRSVAAIQIADACKPSEIAPPNTVPPPQLIEATPTKAPQAVITMTPAAPTQLSAGPTQTDESAQIINDFVSVEAATKNSGPFLDLLKRRGVKGYRDEFRKIRNYLPEGTKNAFNEKDNDKYNRFNSVLLLDATRVKLVGYTGSERKDFDYIHASRIQCGKKQFIATQGPLPETVNHFWHMVVQEETKVIVMLCQFFEDGKEKCTDYLPVKKGKKKRLGDFSVICKESEPIKGMDRVTQTTLEVTPKGKAPMTVVHLHYEGWGDHLAPDDITTAVGLARKAREINKDAVSSSGTPIPIVVHCSAGIGRTGCYVGFEFVCAKACESAFNMDDILRKLRDQRQHCIQNELQYLFLCRSYIEAAADAKFVCRDDYQKFIVDYEKLIVRKKKEIEDKKKGKPSVPSAEVVDDPGGGN